MPLNNAQYDSIIREYHLRQSRHRQDKEARVQKAYEIAPRLKEIDMEIASLSVSSARQLLSGEEHVLSRLRQQIAQLGEERTQVLASAGLPADYMQLTYDCPDCKDTGYQGSQKCHCFKKAEIDLLYMQSNIRPILEKENFDALSFDYYSDEIRDSRSGISSRERMKKAVDTCRQFVQNFDTIGGNLFFYGDTGIGKTFLSHCIAKELIETTHSVIYFSSQMLFERFAKKRFDRHSEEPDFTDYIYDCDLLIIDDLGTELTNSFVNSELFLCLNERLTLGKSTIISTNLPLNVFADTYSERIFSRISNHFTMLKLFGNDIRLQKKIQQIAEKKS